MPDTMPPHWTHVAAGARVPFVRTACKDCTRRLKKPVWLCEGCNDERRCWDHEMAKPAWHCVVVGGGAKGGSKWRGVNNCSHPEVMRGSTGCKSVVGEVRA